MPVVRHNHVHYQERLDFVRQRILVKHLGLSGTSLEQVKVTPISYDPDAGWKYNNFVYRITLPDGLQPEPGGIGRTQQQPGCVPIPDGTKSLIARLGNKDAEGMHGPNRVENEVATINLASAALRHIEPGVVPRVFGWGSTSDAAAADYQGWILQELMPGESVRDAFVDKMDLGQKKGILKQMAFILKGLQDYDLPESITGFGGLTFDRDGRIVSGPLATDGVGPWTSYEEAFRARLLAALASADKNTHIEGWRSSGLRERIEAFIERGLPAHFASLPTRMEKRIVHCDFVADNIMYDPASGRVTALIDYDFSNISHPADEFFHSFSPECGRVRPWTKDEASDEGKLRKALLTGTFPDPLPPNVPDERILWDVARAWDEELAAVGAKRPSTIEGMRQVADADSVLDAIVPFQLGNPDWLAMQDEDIVPRFKKWHERKFGELLEHLGF